MRVLKGERDLQSLAIFVHGALASLHMLGVIYNLRRKNWAQAGIHGAAAAYDAWATSNHIVAIRRLPAMVCDSDSDSTLAA
ncbi:MAG TPA: hypothetical protein VGK99_07075 [Acidobacteriota bacterium]|jgi:hypothetical protein